MFRCGGGKGMYWQEVATHGSSTAGTQLWFQPHTEVSTSYFSPVSGL